VSRASPSNKPTERGRSDRRAGFWIRAAAAAIDAGVGFAASLVLASTAGMFFARRAVVTLRIGEAGTLWQGPLPLMLGIFGEIVYLLPFTLLVAWTLDPLTGATIGKRVCRLRVRTRDGQTPDARAFWRRTVIFTVGFWGWTLALLIGRWEIAALASAGGLIAFAGTFPTLGSRSLAWHDRLTGTHVQRL